MALSGSSALVSTDASEEFAELLASSLDWSPPCLSDFWPRFVLSCFIEVSLVASKEGFGEGFGGLCIPWRDEAGLDNMPCSELCLELRVASPADVVSDAVVSLVELAAGPAESVALVAAVAISVVELFLSAPSVWFPLPVEFDVAFADELSAVGLASEDLTGSSRSNDGVGGGFGGALISEVPSDAPFAADPLFSADLLAFLAL